MQSGNRRSGISRWKAQCVRYAQWAHTRISSLVFEGLYELMNEWAVCVVLFRFLMLFFFSLCIFLFHLFVLLYFRLSQWFVPRVVIVFAHILLKNCVTIKTKREARDIIHMELKNEQKYAALAHWEREKDYAAILNQAMHVTVFFFTLSMTIPRTLHLYRKFLYFRFCSPFAFFIPFFLCDFVLSVFGFNTVVPFLYDDRYICIFVYKFCVL